jgi:hypothetical protein
LGADQTISDEAVEAVAAGVLAYLGPHMNRVGQVAIWADRLDGIARAALAAAVPHIGAAIREKIAKEFEARDVPGLHWVIALEEAAAVARGGSR